MRVEGAEQQRSRITRTQRGVDDRAEFGVKTGFTQ